MSFDGLRSIDSRVRHAGVARLGVVDLPAVRAAQPLEVQASDLRRVDELDAMRARVTQALDRDLVFASAWHNPSLPAEPVEVPRG
jgi:hypothetical protein